MAMTDAFQRFLEDTLSRVCAVTTKRMFGGLGIYCDSVMFALANDSTLFFKVDDTNRSDYESRGMKPFQPLGTDRVMPYYEVPADVLENVDELRSWMEKAIQVSQDCRRPKKIS